MSAVTPASLLRGYVFLGANGVMLLCADLVQRTLIQGLVTLFPARRDRILGAWIHGLAGTILFLFRHVGGARFPALPRIPGQPGVLILMNHQSLLDIPALTASVDGSYPLFVTRQRYARGVPTISHMIRLYGHPTVDPGGFSRPQIRALTETAATTRVPLAIFPEGSRSKTGEIRPFRTAGLKAILAPRRWAVYLLVVDGLWKCRRFKDFAHEMCGIEARASVLGPFSSPAPGEDPDAFIRTMETRMADQLKQLRKAEATGE